MDNSSLDQIVKQAQSAYQDEDFETAATLFQQAREQYLLLNDELNAAEMANNRSVALLRFGNAHEALNVTRGTDLIFAQAGDTHRQAMALGNQAAALEALGQLDEAVQAYRQCSDLLKQSNDPSLRIYVLESLSGLYLRRRRFLEALVTMQAALDLKTKLSLRERVLRWLLNVVFRLMGRG
jgi:tetratricopeptide (TPR) repeat protein